MIETQRIKRCLSKYLLIRLEVIFSGDCVRGLFPSAFVEIENGMSFNVVKGFFPKIIDSYVKMDVYI